MGENIFYLIDTSSLIFMNNFYPMHVFKKLWGNLDELIYLGRLGSPITVFEELSHKDDDVTKWAAKHDDALFLKNYSLDFMVCLSEIIRKFPIIVNPKDEFDSADPYVVAMALEKIKGNQQQLLNFDYCVVTEENRTANTSGKNKKIKIPEVCEHFNIPCIKALDLFVKEKWEF